MSHLKSNKSLSQEIFREIILGTFVYTFVLGFFNDYTNFLNIHSYGVTFLVAIVLEILTYCTLILKKSVSDWFKKHESRYFKYGYFFCIWLILFLSKFVFLEVIYFIFGSKVDINGFIAILILVVIMMIIKQTVDIVYEKLGNLK